MGVATQKNQADPVRQFSIFLANKAADSNSAQPTGPRSSSDDPRYHGQFDCEDGGR